MYDFWTTFNRPTLMNLRKHSTRFSSQYNHGAIVDSDVNCRQGKTFFYLQSSHTTSGLPYSTGTRGFAWGKRLGLDNNYCYLVLQCVVLSTYTRLYCLLFLSAPGPTSAIIVADNLGVPILQFVLYSRCYKIQNYFGYTFMKVVLSAKGWACGAYGWGEGGV